MPIIDWSQEQVVLGLLTDSSGGTNVTVPPPTAKNRGNLDVDQTRDTALSCGVVPEPSEPTRIVTTIGPRSPGEVLVWDSFGKNAVTGDSGGGGGGGGATHTEILTDSHGPILTSSGDFIYVLGVPN